MKLDLIRTISYITAFILLVFSGGCDQKKDNPLTGDQINSFLSERYFEIPRGETVFPNFEYQLMTGEKEKFSDNKGKIILLNFWATWCFPCKKEMPGLEELNHAMKNEKFRLMAVNSGDKKARISKYLDKNPFSFDIIIDEDKRITRSVNLIGLPTTFILNGDLKVIGKVMGPIDWKEKSFIQFLKNMAKHQPS